MMALAGLIVDCALESQSSSCAFSWDPERIENRRKLSQITTPNVLSMLLYMTKNDTAGQHEQIVKI